MTPNEHPTKPNDDPGPDGLPDPEAAEGLSPGAAAGRELVRRAMAAVAAMPLADRLHQLSGDAPALRSLWEMLTDYNLVPFAAGADPDHGIEPLMFSDGPRGVAVGRSTAFPVAMARGAAWDPELEARIGDAMGVEARSQGVNLIASVCVNLLRHPAWGRAQETYGEDPVLLGALGVAAVEGVQRHVMACVKHLAANSMENARFRVDVRMDERTLRELYLPHFKRCVDAGAACVMSAYNRLNGPFCGEHRELLTEILKEEWGFAGFVMSDFFLGVRDGVAGINAGLDMEMPFAWRFRGLERHVRGGAVPLARVNDAAVRVVGQKLRFAEPREPERYGPQAVAGPTHRALAREAAAAGMVLLKNDPVGHGEPVLPLAPSGRLAVIGRLAAVPNLGDIGSSRVRAGAVSTPLMGLWARAAKAGTAVAYVDGRDPKQAAATAARAGAAVLCVGLTAADEGEYLGFAGGDRERLGLRPADEALIAAVAAVQPRTVVVLMGGSAITMEAWRERVPAVLMAWYPGTAGGDALADVLYGDVEPGGRLPIAFPRRAADLPPFDRRADRVDYDLYHGYRYQDAHGLAPAFPFGWGLGYTRFAYGEPELADDRLQPGDELAVRIEVANTGDRAGSTVVQAYVAPPGAGDRPPKELKAFRKLRLGAGERTTLDISIPLRELAFWSVERARWELEAGRYRLLVGSSAADRDLKPVSFTVG